LPPSFGVPTKRNKIFVVRTPHTGFFLFWCTPPSFGVLTNAKIQKP
jgi:hypothetical protein